MIWEVPLHESMYQKYDAGSHLRCRIWIKFDVAMHFLGAPIGYYCCSAVRQLRPDRTVALLGISDNVHSMQKAVHWTNENHKP